jgi:two-component system response regulator (stage 0 sporulation protein F)
MLFRPSSPPSRSSMDPTSWPGSTSETDATGPKAAKRILIVDDDAAIVEMLCGYFWRAGHKWIVDIALDGATAIESVRHAPPNLVLLDIGIPGMDGLVVLREILRIDRSIKVIVLTALGGAAAGDALKLGAFAYVPKPVDVAYLDTLIPLALDQPRTPRLRFGT